MKTIAVAELSLEPLTAAHADEMWAVLADPVLYAYLDFGPPPDVEHVRSVYQKLEKRSSPDGLEQWFNWVVRWRAGGLIGYVQATLETPGTAWVAYFFRRDSGGRGLATAATAAMIGHLQDDHAVHTCLATVEVTHAKSIALLARLGFTLASPAVAAPHGLTASERLFVLRRAGHCATL